MHFWALAAVSLAAQAQSNPDGEFARTIRPGLVQNCMPCHNPANARGPAPFLKATTVQEMRASRGLWRNVAAQLRNRSMPPKDPKLSEQDRIYFASWIEQRLKESACSVPEFAGPAVTRRLNRREFHSTIRDLFGIDVEVTSILPADGTGGAGFDTNGETLYVPPVLMERYMEAAQQILDRVIATPALNLSFSKDDWKTQGGETTVTVPAYLEGAYSVGIAFEPGQQAAKLVLKVDGVDVGPFRPQRRRNPAMKGEQAQVQVNLSRGSHVLAVAGGESVTLHALTVQQRAETMSAEKRATHFRLFGMEAGERPQQGRKTARLLLEGFVAKAFRRPVAAAEVDRFLKLYDRSAERGDPYEESMKLALKAVLVWPDFLFRIEKKHTQPGIYPLTQYELATRLSYFLWSSMPDDLLLRLAEQGKLQQPEVLSAQVDRMLDHPRARAFLRSFIGQWLGTQDIGGRVVPLLTEIQSYYTPEIAADLREQPILMFDRMLSEDRSLLEFLTADYTYMTPRLAKFYQIEERHRPANSTEFRLMQWPDQRRAGLLGLSGVLAMTSRYQETSPVLRGAWVLETLIGTPVPPPPPDVPPLKTDEGGKKVAMRQKLEEHRANAACAACHRLMDPIGLGLENFDWMGRWRDTEADGKKVDATGELPTGEKFNGPVELRNALLQRKSEFVENLAGRMLGYGLGRSLQDGDSCTVQKLVRALEKNNYKARTLMKEIVLSVPFRSTQGGVVHSEPLLSQRTLNVSGLNATKQDAASHNNQVKTTPAKK